MKFAALFFLLLAVSGRYGPATHDAEEKAPRGLAVRLNCSPQ
jgi:hypothetical protein